MCVQDFLSQISHVEVAARCIGVEKALYLEDLQVYAMAKLCNRTADSATSLPVKGHVELHQFLYCMEKPHCMKLLL